MIAAFDLDTEAKWELRAATLGVERYRRSALSADVAQLPPSQRLIRETVGPLLRAFQDNVSFVTGADRKACQSESLRWLAEGDSLVQAAGSVSVAASDLMTPQWSGVGYSDGVPCRPVAQVARTIGAYLLTCRENAMWITEQPKDSALLKTFKARYPEPTAADWRAFRKQHGLERLDVSEGFSVQVGAAVLGWLIDGSPEWLCRTTVYEGVRSVNMVALTDQGTSILADVNARAEVAYPLHAPMIVPPHDWRYDERGNLEGGYSILRVDALRGNRKQHTRAVDRPISEASLGALNAVQKTPWTLNRWLHLVAEECEAAGIVVGDRSSIVAVPKRLSEDEWAALSAEDRTAFSKKRREAGEANASAKGQLDALLNTLVGARQLEGQSAFYFPHSLDFRGRIYPVPTWGPNPQGNDLARSLVMFAEGRPLGPDGLFWLYVRAANCAGQDKLPLEDRVQWCLDNLEAMQVSSYSPVEFVDWWSKMDEPWGFLATCREVSMANALDDPSEFVSHLPVPMDGTCNGLQHLSAMALDTVGATATNLHAGQDRQDIYEDVASEVRDIVDRDIRDDNEEALLWQGKVTRKVVKRAVMTTPYGVTKGGIRTQLLSDGHAPGEGAERGRAAGYLKDCLVEALDRKAGAARGIMAWLQAAAFRLAKAEVPFTWTTPSGNRIQQAYRTQTEERIRTLVGRLKLLTEETTSGLDAKKQSLGAAPNYVHSFDAAHLTNTVLAAQREDISDFAMIHDSYGTHACNTTALARILRDEFVSIYREDWLRKLYDELRAAHPHVDIPEPPGRGDFNLEEVRDSAFFFS